MPKLYRRGIADEIVTINHRIDKVSTDKLISYNEKIKPKVEFKIARKYSNTVRKKLWN